MKIKKLKHYYEHYKKETIFNYIGTERDFISPMWSIYQCEICAEIWRKDI